MVFLKKKKILKHHKIIILIFILDNNCKIFIYNCDTYFLGQKIFFIRRIFSIYFTNEKNDLLKIKIMEKDLVLKVIEKLI